MTTKKIKNTIQASKIDMSEKSLLMNNSISWLQLSNEVSNRKIPLLKKYGATVRVLNSDIEDMMSSSYEMFSECYVLIKDNPELVEYLDLGHVYNYVLFSEDEIDDFLSKSQNEIHDFYNNMAKGMKELFIKMVKIKIERGDRITDSTSKQRFFEELFKIRFSDYYKEPEENLKK